MAFRSPRAARPSRAWFRSSTSAILPPRWSTTSTSWASPRSGDWGDPAVRPVIREKLRPEGQSQGGAPPLTSSCGLPDVHLSLRSHLTLGTCYILLVQRLPDECLNHCLAADIELLGGPIQFFQHARREVHIYPLHRPLHASSISKKLRDILAPVCASRDRFCRGWFCTPTSALHKVPAPVWSPSRELLDGNIPLLYLPSSRISKMRVYNRSFTSRWHDTVAASRSVRRDSKAAKTVPELLQIRYPSSDWPEAAQSFARRSGIAHWYNNYTYFQLAQTSTSFVLPICPQRAQSPKDLLPIQIGIPARNYLP